MHTEWLSSASRASSSGLPLAGRKGPQTLICFSHLRWDFVFQRPQHLMTRFARDRRVIFWEEPIAAFNERYNSLQDGHAAQRVVDAFFADLPVD